MTATNFPSWAAQPSASGWLRCNCAGRDNSARVGWRSICGVCSGSTSSGGSRLPPSRKRTRWANVLQALAAYRLIDPGSEFRLPREWFERSALADLLGEDFALAQKDKLYRCLDLLLPHREALFDHLRRPWGELFQT